jgi:hypothetical protein
MSVSIRVGVLADRDAILALNRAGQRRSCVAEVDGALAGYLIAFGAGFSALYADLEGEAARRDTPRIVCELNLRPPNPRSLAFHERRGFEEVGRMEVSDGRFVALLERSIARRPRVS